MEKVVQVIKDYIQSKGMKQYIVGEMCGYNKQQFNDLLNGRRNIDVDDIKKLCNGLQLSPNQLFGITQEG